MSVSINYLPTEVILKILKNLDGISFVYASRVCVRWHQVSLSVDKLFWKRVCLRDMDKSVLEELCAFHNPQTIEDNDVWKSFYVKWVRGKIVTNTESSTIYTCELKDEINCIKYSGSWILTGHSNGSVCAMSTALPSKKGVIVQHLRLVSDFSPVDLLKSGPYGSINKPWGHHHLISVSYDRVVKLKYLLYELDSCDDGEVIYRHSAVLSQVRVFGDKAVVASTDEYLVFKMGLKKEYMFQVDMRLIKKIIGPVTELIKFNLWRNEMYGVYPDGHWATYCLESEEWKTDRSKSSIFFITNIACRSGRRNQRNDGGVHIFRDRITFLLTEHGYLWISVPEMAVRKFHMMPEIRCSVITIALHGSLLAFGTDSGRLLVYHLPGNVDVAKMDISKPSWHQDLDIGPIIHIDISYEGSLPLIAASSHFKIVVIKWYR